jgi:hypothetical protein
MAEPLKQAQAYAADGTPIATGDVAAALKEGRARFQGGSKVYARDPDGRLVSVAAEEAFTPGYQVLDDAGLKQARLKQQAESASGLAKTGAEGAVRGATMGFLGPEQFYDAEGREAARARQQYNPNLSAGSEIAGALGATLATSALTGGAAAGTTGGRLAQLAARGALTPYRAAAALGEAAEAGAGALKLGQGVLGTAAKMGARGVAEGALMGAGHEVSQAALEDVPLTAERLLAGAWDGAQAGGAFGLGLGVLGGGVGKAGRAIIGRMSATGDDLGKATGSWAEKAAFKQNVGNQGKIFDQATKFGRDEMGPARIGRKLLDADISTKDAVALKQVGELRQDALSRMQGVVRALDDAGVVTNPGNILSQVDDQIAKIREIPFGDAQAVAERIERNIAPFREKIEAAALRDVAPPTRVRLPDGSIEMRPVLPAEPVKLSDLWGFRKQLDESINFEAAQRGPAKEALMDMRSAFVAELDDTIARAAETSGMDPQLLGAWKKATEDYGDMALIEKGLKGLIKQRSKNRAISPSDYAAGSLMALLSGGNPITGMAMGAVSAGVHQLLRERGLGVMAKIADRQGRVAAQMETAGKMAAMVEKTPKRLATVGAVNVQKTFERYSEAVAQAKAEPEKFAEKMAASTADLALRAPELASQIQKTMLADLEYLDQLHPTPATRANNTITPLAPLPQYYAFDQKRAFVDAAMALDNPVGVFDELAAGKLPLAGINALKARRPLLYNEMRATVVKYTTQRTTELPYPRRVLLGTAFDFPADWSMLHVGEIQQSLAAGDPSGKPNDPTAAPSKVGKDPGASINPGQF